ncbi:hypothetical protein ElyMa_004206400 [Elysia marginata]|uniref:Uncharacterized protein n=1 Tax=Elysia marginata TaxID=1093978 RepID=A0AAV4GP94_9GAST|nr:hypothetical protein ElyMa_004206400 [Elysia marginata]
MSECIKGIQLLEERELLQSLCHQGEKPTVFGRGLPSEGSATGLRLVRFLVWCSGLGSSHGVRKGNCEWAKYCNAAETLALTVLIQVLLLFGQLCM